MLLNTDGFLRRLAVALVVAQEDVLEAGLIARQRHDWISRSGFDHCVGRTLDGKADSHPIVQGLDLGHPIEPCERLRRHWLRKRDRDLVALDVVQLVYAADSDDAAVADDR